MRAPRVVLAGLALLTAVLPLAAQPGPPPPPQTIDVFFDCNTWCDFTYIRREIPYVNWVRDRTVADVHVLITEQGTGGGGASLTMAFLGSRAFAGIGDTLRFVAPQGATDDERRQGMTRTIGLGLAPFLARTVTGQQLRISHAPPRPGAAGAAAAPQRDPWNAWVFTVSMNGNRNGEASATFTSIGGSLNARRITNDWKMEFRASENYSQSDFDIDDTTRITSIRRSYNFRPLIVKSLGPRLSGGLAGNIGSSTALNQQLSVRLFPSIEANLFPYTESSRRTLIARYGIGVEHYDYKDTTIYFKLRETRPAHELSLNAEQTQPWGSVYAGVSGSQLLDETTKYSASINASANVRLFKGFSVNFATGYTRIHNQLYLPARGATREQILLRQQQLATNYNYYGFFGINYTFGSVYNSIVNPRFGGGGGGGMIFF